MLLWCLCVTGRFAGGGTGASGEQMKTKWLLLALATTVGLTFAACGGGDPESPSPAGVGVIRSTTSFGFCVGYCRSTLEITAERATYRLVDPRSEQPDLERTVPITAAEWQDLHSAVSRAPFEALPPVVGCPDCADGGAESLEVVADDWSRAITFEYQAPIAQLRPLLDRVRAVRQRLHGELRPGE